MGHADVMSTLPRSPADRTNNSLTHMQHVNIYTCMHACKTSGINLRGPLEAGLRPGQPRHKRAPRITIGPYGQRITSAAYVYIKTLKQGKGC